MNNTSLPTSPVRHSKSPPFDSPLLHAHNLHQNPYNVSQALSGNNYDHHYMNPALSYAPQPPFAPQPSFSMQPMSMYQHQRQTSFLQGPPSFHQAPIGAFGQATVNPQLTLSPPQMDSSWPQASYFPPGNIPKEHIARTQPSRPSRGDDVASAPAALDESVFNVSPNGLFHLALLDPAKDSRRERPQQLPSMHKSNNQLSKEALLSQETSGALPKTRSGPQSDSSDGVPLKSKSVRQAPRRTASDKQKRLKRPRPEEESEDEDDSTDEAKFHKACHHCRKQKSKCDRNPKKPDEKCKACRTRNLSCFVDLRSQRRIPVSRKELQAQLDQKNAIIEYYGRRLAYYILQNPASENLSSASPPSSAAYEEPLRRHVLEWLDKAQPSHEAFEFMNLDGRAFNETSSSSDEEDVTAREHDGQQHEYAGGRQSSRPGLHPTAPSMSGVNGPGMGHLELSDSRSARSRSPRVTRGANISIRTPVDVLAAASLRGANANANTNTNTHQNGSTPGEAPLPTSPSSIDIGVARPDYFVSGDPLVAKFSQLGLRRIEIDRGLSEEPKLLRKGLIVPDEVDKLFAIFWEKLNPSINLLDQALHTPATTFARCPLLFTVVCAIASRHYTERPELYSIAMHFAMNSAASSLMDSKKSVELCQAYLLLSTWPLPCRKYDDDRAWLYLGLAIRMAMDLNLHIPVNVKAADEHQAREILNRTRTWPICFNMDRSSSAQLGKPMTIRENYMIRNSKDWYRSSEFNTPYDIHLCQMTTLMRIMSCVQDIVYADMNTPSGLRANHDLRRTAFVFDDKIVAWEQRSMALFTAEDVSDDPACRYRRHLLPFYSNYSRLVVLSIGFQYSFRMGLLKPGDDLITRCLDAAQKVIGMMVDDPAARPYLRHAPDSHLVFASFASAFLLKLLRHKFVHLIDEEQRLSIIPLVERLIHVLSEHSVTFDDAHSPKIYARFLASLLRKHRLHEAEAAHKHDAGGSAERDRDHDTTMNGLTIDINTVLQQNGILQGPLSPPSPHPSIQVTPPPFGDEPYVRYMPSDGTEGAMAGSSNADLGLPDLFGYDLSLGISAAFFGSDPVRALEESTCEHEDDDGMPGYNQMYSDQYWAHNPVSSMPPSMAALNGGEKDLSNFFANF